MTDGDLPKRGELAIQRVGDVVTIRVSTAGGKWTEIGLDAETAHKAGERLREYAVEAQLVEDGNVLPCAAVDEAIDEILGGD